MNTINILCVILSGVFMAFMGIVLFFFKDQMVLRYFLPIPPIAVASYVFVFNVIKDYGQLPQTNVSLISEIIKSTLIAGAIFGTLTSLIMLTIKIIKA
jgi:hypothetical protein